MFRSKKPPLTIEIVKSQITKLFTAKQKILGLIEQIQVLRGDLYESFLHEYKARIRDFAYIRDITSPEFRNLQREQNDISKLLSAELELEHELSLLAHLELDLIGTHKDPGRLRMWSSFVLAYFEGFAGSEPLNEINDSFARLMQRRDGLITKIMFLIVKCIDIEKENVSDEKILDELLGQRNIESWLKKGIMKKWKAKMDYETSRLGQRLKYENNHLFGSGENLRTLLYTQRDHLLNILADIVKIEEQSQGRIPIESTTGGTSLEPQDISAAYHSEKRVPAHNMAGQTTSSFSLTWTEFFSALFNERFRYCESLLDFAQDENLISEQQKDRLNHIVLYFRFNELQTAIDNFAHFTQNFTDLNFQIAQIKDIIQELKNRRETSRSVPNFETGSTDLLGNVQFLRTCISSTAYFEIPPESIVDYVKTIDLPYGTRIAEIDTQISDYKLKIRGKVASDYGEVTFFGTLGNDQNGNLTLINQSVDLSTLQLPWHLRFFKGKIESTIQNKMGQLNEILIKKINEQINVGWSLNNIVISAHKLIFVFINGKQVVSQTQGTIANQPVPSKRKPRLTTINLAPQKEKNRFIPSRRKLLLVAGTVLAGGTAGGLLINHYTRPKTGQKLRQIDIISVSVDDRDPSQLYVSYALFDDFNPKLRYTVTFWLHPIKNGKMGNPTRLSYINDVMPNKTFANYHNRSAYPPGKYLLTIIAEAKGGTRIQQSKHYRGNDMIIDLP